MSRFECFNNISSKPIYVGPTAVDVYDALTDILTFAWSYAAGTARTLDELDEVNKRFEDYVSQLDKSYSSYCQNERNDFGCGVLRVVKKD